MKPRPSWRSPPALALLLAAAAIAGALVAWPRIVFYRNQTVNRIAEWTELRRLADDARRQRREMDWVAANARPEDQLMPLLRRLGLADTAVVAARGERPAAEGWVIRDYEARFERLSPEALGQLLAALDNARPPIRCLSVHLTAGREGPAVELLLAELRAAGLHSPP